MTEHEINSTDVALVAINIAKTTVRSYHHSGWIESRGADHSDRPRTHGRNRFAGEYP